MDERIDYAALVMLVENHPEEFADYSGGVPGAMKTLEALKEHAGEE